MSKPAIFIGEPYHAVRLRLKKHFRRAGFAVAEASNRTGILRALRQHQDFHVLLLNASLDTPRDGLEVAQQIRAWDRKIAIILLAQDSSEEFAIAALRAGVSDYFRQPDSLDELAESVSCCLSLLPTAHASTNPTPRAETDTILIGGQSRYAAGQSVYSQDRAYR